jgi:hypothetical protein
MVAGGLAVLIAALGARASSPAAATFSEPFDLAHQTRVP